MSALFVPCTSSPIKHARNIPCSVYKEHESGDRIFVRGVGTMYFTRGDDPNEVFYPMVQYGFGGTSVEATFSVRSAVVGDAHVAGSFTPRSLVLGKKIYTRVGDESAGVMSAKILDEDWGNGKVMRLSHAQHRVEYAFVASDGRCILITAPAIDFTYDFRFFAGMPGKLEAWGDDWKVTRYRDGGTTNMVNEKLSVIIHASWDGGVPIVNGSPLACNVSRIDSRALKALFGIENWADFGVVTGDMPLPLPAH